MTAERQFAYAADLVVAFVDAGHKNVTINLRGPILSVVVTGDSGSVAIPLTEWAISVPFRRHLQTVRIALGATPFEQELGGTA